MSNQPTPSNVVNSQHYQQLQPHPQQQPPAPPYPQQWYLPQSLYQYPQGHQPPAHGGAPPCYPGNPYAQQLPQEGQLHYYPQQHVQPHHSSPPPGAHISHVVYPAYNMEAGAYHHPFAAHGSHIPLHNQPQNDLAHTGKAPVPLYAIATTNSSKRAKVSGSLSSPAHDTPSKQQSTTSDPQPPNPQQQQMDLKDLNQERKKSFRTSRRRHRNSHLGCATCKSRRIKCDEQLPECKNCIRARLSCAYLALDDAARESLKEAQKSHALRIESLNQQQQEHEEKLALQYQQQQHHQQHMSQRELELQGHHPMMSNHYFLNELNPYISKSFMYSLPSLPMPTSQPLEINLQKSSFPPINSTLPPPQFPPRTINSVPKYPAEMRQNNASPSRAESDIVSNDFNRESSSSSISTNHGDEQKEPLYSVESDVYDSLHALIKHHQDYIPLNDFAKIDGEYIEIILDPECLRYLNTYWTEIENSKLERFKNGFEKEDLYAEYEKYQRTQFREATYNFVLFKALLTVGQVVLHDKSQDEEIKANTMKFLTRDFELSLRFLNKFRISFNTFNVDSLRKAGFDNFNCKQFHENVSIVFSKFQIFQSAILTSFHGPYNLKDHMEITDRFFQFIDRYIRNQFEVFNCKEITQRFNDNKFFKHARMLNDLMHIYIIYYVQCIKSYHTRPYNYEFLREILDELKTTAKNKIFDKLSISEQKSFSDLESYLSCLLQYIDSTKTQSTNKYRILFFIIKRFVEIIPEEFNFGNTNRPFESHLLMGYFNAVTSALRECFPETRFFFLYSFSGKQGTLVGTGVSKYYESLIATKEDGLSTEELDELKERKELMNYPIKIFEFLKKRLFLTSQYLSEISSFPAKIVLDDPNRTIVFNLLREEQLTSFKSGDIPESSYPNVDKTSNFYNKASDTIKIPSVSTIPEYKNFGPTHEKRRSILTKSTEMPFTEIDGILLQQLYPK